MSLLAAVCQDLAKQRIPHAVVGGLAMAAHGVARATLDADVLIVTSEVPRVETWASVRNAGGRVETRLGDPDDPFRGVIRVTKTGSGPVDVVVGRSAWQQQIIARATPSSVIGADVPVVTAADLILLKLFAGGPQDLWDVERLLAGASRDTLIAAVESRIADLPAACRTQWEKVK